MIEKMEKKLLSLLGLASKSGNIVVGQKSLRSYISSSQHKKLVIFSSDFGESMTQIVKKCETRNIPYLELSVEKEELGRYVGKKAASAVGIIGETFVDGILKSVNGFVSGGK